MVLLIVWPVKFSSHVILSLVCASVHHAITIHVPIYLFKVSLYPKGIIFSIRNINLYLHFAIYILWIVLMLLGKHMLLVLHTQVSTLLHYDR